MKKFIFGIIAIVIALAVWMSFGNKDVAAVMGQCFTEEIKAWNELYSSLSNFCIGVVHLEWFGGSGAGPIKKTALLDAVNKRASSVSMPAEVKDSYGKEQLQRYRTLYEDIMNSRGKLPDALDKWLKTRDIYKGSSAAALDDMTDVVGFSPTSPEEENTKMKENIEKVRSYLHE